MTISLEQVSYHYPSGRDGVCDINFAVAAGELLAVVGASGSGKTTLLKLLSGFLIPDRGSIVVDGRDISRTPVEKRNLGVMFQSYALFQHMNAWRNVAYPLKVRGSSVSRRRAKAFQALSVVGLAGMEERLPAHLSGGQQQRVALARALVFAPKALLLDEPLSALDASLRATMRDEITKVQRAVGITTLLVTHDREEALSMADRIAVIEGGRIAQIATAQELYDAPKTPAVAAFIGRANLWDGVVIDRTSVATGLGVLCCDTGAFPPGGKVSVLVRPEKVIPLSRDDRAAETVNLFAGSVVNQRCFGPVVRYDLVGDGWLIQGETHFRGEISAVSIPPQVIRILPARADGAQLSHRQIESYGRRRSG